MAKTVAKLMVVPVALVAGFIGLSRYQSSPAVPRDSVHRGALILEVCFRKGWHIDLQPGRADACAIPLLLEVADQPAVDVRRSALTFLKYRAKEQSWRSWDRGDFGRLLTELHWNRKDGWLLLDPAKGTASIEDGTFPYSMTGLWMSFEDKWDSSIKTTKPRDLRPFAALRWSDAKIDAFILETLKNDKYENGRWDFEGKSPPATWYVQFLRALGL